ncbi:MAG: pyridoxamine 5'-phosphate oxidase family protein, partial [Actinomycetes bacterium]
MGPTDLPEQALEFLSEYHLASLTTLRADGSPHVVPVGFSWDPEAGLVRIITRAGSQKVRNAARGGRAAVSQVDGGRWLTLEGTIAVTQDPDRV